MPLTATPECSLGSRLGTLLGGLVLVSTGVALMIRGELGVAPYDVLTTGLSALTGLPIGVAAMVTPVVFAAIGWVLGRRPGPGTVLAVGIVGPMLGLVLSALPSHEAMVPRVALFGLGFLAVAAGITAVIIAEIGPGPAELVMLAIHDRGYPLAPVRTGIELVCVAVGWAIGGQVGVGTVVVAVLIGPVLRWMLAASGLEPARAVEATDIAAPFA